MTAARDRSLGNTSLREFDANDYWMFIRAGQTASLTAGMFLGFGLLWLFGASVVISLLIVRKDAVFWYVLEHKRKLIVMFIIELLAAFGAVVAIAKLTHAYPGQLAPVVYISLITIPIIFGAIQLIWAKQFARQVWPPESKDQNR